METYIIIGIIALILGISVFTTVRRLKNKSCCSGGGSKTLKEHKKLTDPVIMKKSIRIDGMHCDNCRTAVERRIEKLEGALCSVNLAKKTAVVKLSREISDEELTDIITALDFTVLGIETEVLK
ncbi:MAG: heavy-metal-associated domain-containing protein [Oscillospiraceae bacterium]|nr:heavy-metal-associated domain-containing protein [Oscillospiraceae bacterium]